MRLAGHPGIEESTIYQHAIAKNEILVMLAFLG
jgi:hypothetical protein